MSTAAPTRQNLIPLPSSSTPAAAHGGDSPPASSTIFRAKIQCPKNNTSVLNFNIYLSSVEGDKSQDEIDFEFLGKYKAIVQINYYTSGIGNREVWHDLGFDCSDGIHEYVIKWETDASEWLIDGNLVRREEKKDSERFPEKPVFLYASVWDASNIAEGKWTGPYVGWAVVHPIFASIRMFMCRC